MKNNVSVMNDPTMSEITIVRQNETVFKPRISTEDVEYVHSIFSTLHVNPSEEGRHYYVRGRTIDGKRMYLAVAIAKKHYPDKFKEFEALGIEPQVDHIDRNPMHNEYWNLRVVDADTNAQNKRPDDEPPGCPESATQIRLRVTPEGKLLWDDPFTMGISHPSRYDDAVSSGATIHAISFRLQQGNTDDEIRDWAASLGHTPEWYESQGFPRDHFKTLLQQAYDDLKWRPKPGRKSKGIVLPHFKLLDSDS